jgi:hypothetical protein
MEGILFDIEMFASPVTVLLGLVLLAIGACGILLGYMADEEASGKEIFRAESPFTDLGETPVESVKYLRAAWCRHGSVPGGLRNSAIPRIAASFLDIHQPGSI